MGRRPPRRGMQGEVIGFGTTGCLQTAAQELGELGWAGPALLSLA